MTSTKIEWADVVWNPTSGCSRVSDGCENCYARRMAYRLRGRFGYPAEDPFKVTLHPERLDEPLRWRQPKRVFVNSMGDLFHDDVPDEFIYEVYHRIMFSWEKKLGHIFMVLTKRPERMAKLWKPKVPLDNLWLGVTCENQQAADERIPLLLQTPAAVRFVSVEPMLGPVDLRRIPGFYFPGCTTHDALNGRLIHHDDGDKATPDEKLDWVIVGGETGPNARPCHPDWVRSLRDQCQEAGVPIFLKQLGEWAEIEADAIPRKGKPMCILLNSDGRSRGIEDAPFAEEIGTVVMCRIGKKLAGRLLDGRTWDEFPA